MNGLLLPSGSKQPLRGDAALSVASPIQLKAEESSSLPHTKAEVPSPTSTAPVSHGLESVAGSSRSHLTSSQSRPGVSAAGGGRSGPRGSSASSSAAALAFIPKTARNSAAVQKPVHLCSEFELEQRLDRNERILSTLEATKSPTKDRLRAETELIRDAIRSIRAMRDVNDGISTVKLDNPSNEAELESALLGLTVKESSQLGTSPPTESFGWSRDTVGVKKRLAQSSGTYHPGRKVQAMSYEQSLAIQSAALLAERERERRIEDSRLKSTTNPRDKLARKSISSCSSSMRKFSKSHSVSPPKSRAAGPFARNMDLGPEHDAELEGGDSDQDDAGFYDLPGDEEDEDPHPGPRHEDEGFGFDHLGDEDQ